MRKRFIAIIICTLVLHGSLSSPCPIGKSCSPDISNCPTGQYSALGDTECRIPGPGYTTTSLKDSVQLCPDKVRFSDLKKGIDCSPCPEDYSCDGPNILHCAPGHYSNIGENSCSPCPNDVGQESALWIRCNQRTDEAHTTFSKTCEAGKYLENEDCRPCPTGKYCPGTPPIFKDCLEGQYSTGSQSHCTVCPAGSYCSTTTKNPTVCEPGYYSLMGYSKCEICPPGFSCAEKNSLPTRCTGTSFAVAGSTECRPCPAGKFCTHPSSVPQSCALGEYSLEGDGLCTLCPGGRICTATGLGEQCPEETYAPYGSYTSECLKCGNDLHSLPGSVKCSAQIQQKRNLATTCTGGTYESSPSVCLPCPGGRLCSSTSLGSYCTSGYYASAGTYYSSCSACSEGYYCSGSGVVTPSICGSGTYSSSGASSCTTCEAGYKCPNTYASSRTQCTGGTYSLGGATSCTTCPGGRACQYNSLGSYCTEGYYISSGVYDSTCNACGLGTYSGSAAASCTTCEAGYLCTTTKESNKVQCTGGAYSLGGAYTSCTACPGGRYCQYNTLGSYCSAGTYASAGVYSTCSSCTSGYYSSSGASSCTGCPGGALCAATGLGSTCSSGTYALPLVYTSSCTSCPGARPCSSSSVGSTCSAGQYAPANVYTSCLSCPKAYYCGAATTTPSPCTVIGTYSGLGYSSCVTCEAGYKCPTFSIDNRAQCTGGQYSLGSETTCTDCPGKRACLYNQIGSFCTQGYYVPFKYYASPCLTCPAGYYCLNNCDTPILCGLRQYSLAGSYTCTTCEADYYCPDPSQHLPCPAGKYSNEGSLYCDSCPSGWWCNPISTSSKGLCPTGYYSPANYFYCLPAPVGYTINSFRNETVLCPSSTPYSNVEEGVTSCVTCPPGYACNGAVITMCSAGYYSNGGRTTCLQCPANNICPDRKSTITCSGKSAGSTDIICSTNYDIFCDAGTYLNGGVCSNCPAGKFCPGSPLTATSCPSGYYSLGSASVCTPCPAGSKCASTSASPVSCSSGYYSLIAYTSCIHCPAGFSCSTTNAKPIRCSEGTYSLAGATSCTNCPAGSSCETTSVSPVACSSGYYSAAGSTYCAPCPGGKTCSSTGVGSTCTSGYYLDQIIWAASCTQCPQGSYCPVLDRPPLSCPTGTYSSAGSTSCTVCEAGYKCINNMASGRSACLPGTYSLEASSTCTVCPDGYICPNTATSSPTACVAGYYSASNFLSCLPCEESYACPDGQSSTRYSCPSDMMSGALATRCTAIPYGSYCPSRKQSECVTCGSTQYLSGNTCVNSEIGKYFVDVYQTPEDCPAGWYSAAGATKCTICDAGKVCPNIDGSGIYSCPAGTYSEPGTYTSCTLCPAGKICPYTNRPLQLMCDLGYYAPNTGMTACIICPADHQCQDLKTAVACKPHTYSLEGWGVCRPCPPGQYCTVNPPADCGVGKYSAEGDRDCHNCPVGHYCPKTRNSQSIICLPGTIQPLTTQASCADCPPGSYSMSGETACHTCPAGYYCPNIKIQPIICGLGTYSNNGATSCSDCSDGYLCLPGSTTATPSNQKCPEGFYCVHANQDGVSIQRVIPCPAGKYGTVSGGSTILNACTDCPIGYFCPVSGMVSPIPCKKGAFCDTVGLSSIKLCPDGTYQPEIAMTSSSACLTCPTGNYCPSGSPDPVECPAGYLCASGSGSSTGECPAGTYSSLKPIGSTSDCITCPEGSYCPAHSVTPIYCPAGTYNLLTGKATKDDCLPCSAGIACFRSYRIPCPPGYFCPQGTMYPTQFPCPKGTYSNAYNLVQESQCSQCPAGYACTNGTNKFNNQMLKCAAGHYCPAGSVNTTQFPCPAGVYQPYTGVSTLGECSNFKCPPGYYCPEGSKEPAGECKKGFFCVEGSIKEDNEPCPAGTYATSTALKSQNECIVCEQGYYCEVNGTYETRVPCPAGKYNPFTGKTSIADCLSCQEGYYCPTAALVFMKSCGYGYYSAANSLACIICPSGFHCSSPNTKASQITSKEVECKAGFVCPTGVAEYPSTALACPVGHYCLDNTVFPKTCPPGTYNPRTGGKSEADCVICPAGYYTIRASSSITGDCSPGYYCPEGSTRAKMIACPATTFRSKSRGLAQSDCGPCPAGYYCPMATVNPIGCPIGHYCGPSVDYPTKCPMGTFGASPLLRDLAQCTQCWSGRYCSVNGLTLPDGKCDPGYYCIASAVVPNPTDGVTGGQCPAGGVCPQGTSTPQPCLPGTYSNAAGKKSTSECVGCPAGKYCIGEVRNTYTGLCKAGYYCPGSSKTETDKAAIPGYYAPTGASVQTACSQGYYSENYASPSCTPCPAGYYCPSNGNSGVFTICPVGYYCPQATYSPVACPDGTYNPVTGLRESSQCTTCPPGKYCTAGRSSPNGDCTLRYYCPPGQSSSAPYSCSPGHYCPTGTGIELPCPPGTYTPYTQRYDSSQCTSCTAGYYCEQTGLSTPTGKCHEGYYCPSGQSSPRPENYYCNIGQYCPEGSSSANSCPAGTYQNSVKQGSCMPCPRGYYCTAGSSQFASGKDCPAGYYCPEGTSYSTQYPCPQGTYNPYTNAFSSEQCINCDPGYYCTGNGRQVLGPKCNAGYYCISGSYDNTPTDGTRGYYCQAGYYCPQGTTYPIPASPGKYISGIRASTDGSDCSAGYYCILHSITPSPSNIASHGGYYCTVGYYCPSGSSEPIPCPAGTYYATIRAESSAYCIKAPNGYYIPNPGSTTYSSVCSAGYYCDASSRTTGFTTPTPAEMICPPGYYCPQGTSTKIACSSTTYQELSGQSSCVNCPAGYECTATTKTLCKPGDEKTSFYCPANQRTRVYCSDGYFNTAPGSSSASDCLLCPKGKYCPSSPTSTQEKINQCPAGYYCPQGTGTSPIMCPARYYCPAGSAEYYGCLPGYYCNENYLSYPYRKCSAGYHCIYRAYYGSQVNTGYTVACPAGHYCPEGTPEPIPCPAGTYRSSTGGATINDCWNCPNTNFCLNRAMTSQGSNCPAGYYCPSGTQQDKKNPCQAGYRCPSNSYQQTLCEDGTYQPLPVQASCIQCPSRYYCKNTNPSDSVAPKICPTGYYCAAGSQPVACPIGTFNPREGMASSSECEPCPPGKICDSTGLSTPPKPCTAGYYCVRGAYSSPPASDSTGGNCPQGHYCPEGTISPIACPPGTINDAIRKTVDTDCLACPATYYCPYRGGYSSRYYIGTNNNFRCQAGYLCFSKSVTPTPTDGTTGRQCATGKYCVFGSNTEYNCPTGYYNPYEGQTSCLPCPAGRLCSGTGLVTYSDCPLGGYCPGTTSTPTPCPSGTYNPGINIKSASECYDCNPGKYCLGGSSTTTGDCAAGYICMRRATSPSSSAIFSYITLTEGKCPKGSFCPQGTKGPNPCPVGTYQDEVGQTSCKTCPANYYCPVINITDPTIYPCYPGYICEGGATTPTPLGADQGGRPCKAGFYCVQTSASNPIIAEIPCPAGTYEPRTGSTKCQDCPAGFYCTVGLTDPIECPANKYCPANTITPITCPNGKYSTITGLQKEENCRYCPSGEYCQNGKRIGACLAGYFCAAGASIPNDPSMLCPAGSFCEQGTNMPTVCPEGTVRESSGGKVAADCTSCPIGYYCLLGSSTPFACPRGHYCPLGSNEPIACSKGTYSNVIKAHLSTTCQPCPIGYYCTELGLADYQTQRCTVGHYCNVSTEYPRPCPATTYCNITGASSISECKICPEGFYCKEETVTPKICDEGTYCPIGSESPTICPAKYYCRYTLVSGTTISKRNPCPGGYYCPKGTINPIKCQNGYYCAALSSEPTTCPSGTTGTNNENNFDSASGCTSCQPGTYSTHSSSSSTVCEPCSAGYICLMGTTTATPTNEVTDHGYECPKGYYCPEGSYEAIPCPTGTFNNKLKGTSLSSCYPCDYNTYNDLEGQTGCKPCGPSSSSDLGESTCTCKGKNRVFHMSNGKCFCKQFYTSIIFNDTEDSKKDCRPILLERCSTGYLRDAYGNCVLPDNCEKECGSVGGKRSSGVGICVCNSHQDLDNVCNYSCRHNVTTLTITQSGKITIQSSSYNGISSISSSASVLGEPKCPAGNCSLISLYAESSGGLSASYQTSKKLMSVIVQGSRLLSQNSDLSRRLLADSESVTTVNNPTICIKRGDSVSFDIPDANHYPVYSQNALANSNPNFDYSSFTLLGDQIAQGDVPSIFIFTFNQAGVYVFSEFSEPSKLSIIAVMSDNENCPSADKYITPITPESLILIGVKQQENFSLTPNWIFIGCCFVVLLVLVPGIIICLSYFYNKSQKQKKLASISFAKAEERPEPTDRNSLSINRSSLDVSEDYLNKTNKSSILDMKGKEEEGEVDPGIFEEIYTQLRQHSKYVREEFEKKSAIDEENIKEVWRYMRELKQLVKNKLQRIAKIFGKNVKYLFAKKKHLDNKEDPSQKEEKEIVEVESEESDHETYTDQILKSVEAKNSEDMKELLQIQQKEEEKMQEFMKSYVRDQKRKLEAFKERIVENANMSESDKKEMLHQYETQLQDMQKELLIYQKEQQLHLRLRLDVKRNHRGELANQLDKLNAQKRELILMMDKRMKDLDISIQHAEAKIDEEAAKEKRKIENDMEMQKKDALRKHQAQFDNQMKRTSNSKMRTELLEQMEKETQEIEEHFESEKKNKLSQLVSELEKNISIKKEALKENAIKERDIIKTQKKNQLDSIRDLEIIIMNKLGNVAIDEKLVEALEHDMPNYQSDLEHYNSLKKKYISQVEEIEFNEAQKLKKIHEESSKDEDLIKEDYEVQKRIITNSIKKKSGDILQSREKFEKELKNNMLEESEEQAIKLKIKQLDELLSKRISEEVFKQEEDFQRKLQERRKLRSQNEANAKELSLAAKSKLDKEWMEKEPQVKSELHKNRLSRLISELKSRTKDEELPIAIENVIESIQMEELTDILGKQYKEKAFIMSEKIGNLIPEKLIEIHNIKEKMQGQYDSLKLSLEQGTLPQFDYQRRLRDIQSIESDQLRDIELKFIQKQNDLEYEIWNELSQKHESELILLREQQLKQKHDLISEIALMCANSDSSMQLNIQKIVGGGELQSNIEFEDYKRQLQSLRERKMKDLEEKRNRLQEIAIENEDQIRKYNEGTKKIISEQAKREHEREQKNKAELDRLKTEFESKLHMQEGMNNEEKARLLQEHQETLDRLQREMDTERKRQSERMMEKLEERIRHKDQMRAQKQIQLIQFKRESNEKMEHQIAESHIKLDTKIEMTDLKAQVNEIAIKYESCKSIFDKTKKLEGVLNIEELSQIQNIEKLRDEENKDPIEGILANIDFDGLYEKISTMETRIDQFNSE